MQTPSKKLGRAASFIQTRNYQKFTRQTKWGKKLIISFTFSCLLQLKAIKNKQ